MTSIIESFRGRYLATRPWPRPRSPSWTRRALADGCSRQQFNRRHLLAHLGQPPIAVHRLSHQRRREALASSRRGVRASAPSRREALLEKWNAGWSVLLQALETLADDQIARQVAIRRQTMSVHEALSRSLAHLSYHVGQIVYIAKARCGASFTVAQHPTWRLGHVSPEGMTPMSKKTFKATIVRDGSMRHPATVRSQGGVREGACTRQGDGERLHLPQHDCGDGRSPRVCRCEGAIARRPAWRAASISRSPSNSIATNGWSCLRPISCARSKPLRLPGPAGRRSVTRTSASMSKRSRKPRARNPRTKDRRSGRHAHDSCPSRARK